MLSDSVTTQTAQDVSALYEQLWNLRPPQSTNDQRVASDAARVFAAERGWLPPLAWDDIDTDPDPRHTLSPQRPTTTSTRSPSSALSLAMASASST